MADATSNSAVIDSTSSIRQSPSKAGWIGSKAGEKGDFITKDANGYYDQAAAAANRVGATVQVALLPYAVAVGVLIDTDASKKVEARKILEETLIELQWVNGSDVRVTVTAALEGDSAAIRRCTNGDYAADAGATTHLEVVRADVDNNTVICRVKPGLRLA